MAKTNNKHEHEYFFLLVDFVEKTSLLPMRIDSFFILVRREKAHDTADNNVCHVANNAPKFTHLMKQTIRSVNDWQLSQTTNLPLHINKCTKSFFLLCFLLCLGPNCRGEKVAQVAKDGKRDTMHYSKRYTITHCCRVSWHVNINRSICTSMPELGSGSGG